jgi:hypothetical protein
MMKHWLTQQRFSLRSLVAALTLSGLMCIAPSARAAEPIIYTVKFPAPETRIAEVEAAFPTGKRAVIELMMPVWSPGFYRVEDYASRVGRTRLRRSARLVRAALRRRRQGGERLAPRHSRGRFGAAKESPAEMAHDNLIRKAVAHRGADCVIFVSLTAIKIVGQKEGSYASRRQERLDRRRRQ